MLHSRKLNLGVTVMAASVALSGATASALVIDGTPNHDRIIGSNQADQINGKGGPDRVFALAGDDSVLTGAQRT